MIRVYGGAPQSPMLNKYPFSDGIDVWQVVLCCVRGLPWKASWSWYTQVLKPVILHFPPPRRISYGVKVECDINKISFWEFASQYTWHGDQNYILCILESLKAGIWLICSSTTILLASIVIGWHQCHTDCGMFWLLLLGTPKQGVQDGDVGQNFPVSTTY